MPSTAELAALPVLALDWYAANGRDLAFRQTSDPWAILVSEVMAQQTQAARAAAAWTAFMGRYPTAAALAAASPADVIRAWRGLGYNRRALALHRAAVAIVAEHGGRVPNDMNALLRLPGIGPYTARAVLAIAFGRSVAALDVNIRRVIGRAFLDASNASSRGPQLQALADGFVPAGRAADWTHALMDVGAAFCRPREPRCADCPLRPTCRFAADPGRGATSPQPASPSPAIRFELTTRWLRGRILDRLRDAPGWVAFSGRIGAHDELAVARAVASMAEEGLVERRGARARLRVA